mgnify:CR=1 FL=1
MIYDDVHRVGTQHWAAVVMATSARVLLLLLLRLHHHHLLLAPPHLLVTHPSRLLFHCPRFSRHHYPLLLPPFALAVTTTTMIRGMIYGICSFAKVF